MTTQNSTPVYNIENLINAHTALTDRDKAVERLTAMHNEIDNIVNGAELNKTQAAKLREHKGLGKSLEADIAALKVDETVQRTLDALREEHSVTLWAARIAELAPLNDALESANKLRELLGAPPLYLAYNAKRKTRSGKAATSANGGEQHTATRTKYMRPGVLPLSHADVDFTVTADVDKIVVEGGGHTVEHKQGSKSVPQILLEFVRETLGFGSGTNFSTPSAKLAPAGFHADDVYMLTPPNADTPHIPQPERDGEGNIVKREEPVIGLV